ncbi:hypothetical protein QA612_20455 [Evansella sp. AB-P1]|uniref:hypothetical protein n=1 Tax=Evansella sp. AB-P1 TaxID=3037653 RepID=UPI00241D212B|nr:hypothetical protein [Evansella sp. AB-P1]MDG5789832.1 hypothetical protein [Evansella sp. AB-P1]
MTKNLIFLKLRSVIFLMMLLLFITGCEIDITINGNSNNENTQDEELNDENNNNDSTDEDSNNNGLNEDANDNETEENEVGVDNENSNDSTLEDDADISNENGTDGNEADDGISVLNYLPMEVGYVHNVGGNVPDGFGEFVEVIGAQNDYYLATGGSTSMGFYRLYEVNDQQATILFEANEEHTEYYEIDDFLSAGNMNDAIDYAVTNSNKNFVLLQAPLEEGTSWNEGIITNTHVNALQTDESIVFALLVDYEDREELRYFEEGVGLVGIVHYSQQVQDLFGGAVYAKNIVD